VRKVFGRSCPVADIQRRHLQRGGSFDVSIVTITLETGVAFNVVLKDLGACRADKGCTEQSRHREMRVYQDLLGDGDLGTAKYYDAVCDQRRQRLWLLLEHVQGRRIQRGEITPWEAAACWLARLHGHFAQRADRLRACPFLVRHDADFFRTNAERAQRVVSSLAEPSIARRVARILKHYDRAVAVMVGQPVTLVHGSFGANDILLVDAAAGQEQRICPVDWEHAAVGSPLFDLSYFTYRFNPSVVSQILFTYRHEALRRNAPLFPLRETEHALSCLQLHRCFTRLRKCARRKTKAEVEELVARAERIAARALVT